MLEIDSAKLISINSKFLKNYKNKTSSSLSPLSLSLSLSLPTQLFGKK
jgi:hypothetical protein